MTKLVLCDCDGTLVDSELLGNRALAETLGLHGYTITEHEATDRFKGMKLAHTIGIIEKESGLTMPAEFEGSFRHRMAEIFESSLVAIEGAKELVESFAVDFCVVSNGPTGKIEQGLRLTGLLPHFEGNVFSAYEIGIWKPEPGLFQYVADKFERKPSDCIVIEDSLPGIEAGIAAGMLVCVYNPDEQSFPSSPMVKNFKTMKDLRSYLASIGVCVA